MEIRLHNVPPGGRVPGVDEVNIVHPVPAAEMPGWHHTMAVTFLEDPAEDATPDNVEFRRRVWQPDRRWGAWSGGHWVATLGTLDRTLTVPGGRQLRADALSMVTVAATHRRRGVLTAMLGESLAAAKDRGDAVSILIAAEWAIYGRFGYSPAELTAFYSLDPRRPGATVQPSGNAAVRPVGSDEFDKQAPAVFDAARVLRAGQIDRPTPWWDRTLGRVGLSPAKVHGRVPNRVVRDGPHGVDGYLTWIGTRDFDVDGSTGAIEVVDLCASSDAAYRDLWAYLTGMDAVSEIVLVRRPVDEPVRWLMADGRALRSTHVGDGIWLRLLDVTQALSARSYACADSLVLEVIDHAAGSYAAGRYRLSGGPDGASCDRVDQEPDLRLDQRALASCYLGGFTLAGQAQRGLVHELRPGGVRRLDAMLTTPLAPWCATMF